MFIKVCQGCSIYKAVLENFTELTEKYLCHTLFFTEFVGLRSATLSKMGLRHRYLNVNFAKFLRTPMLKNICERQLLKRSTFTDPQPYHKKIY